MELERLITRGEGLRGKAPDSAAVILWDEECAAWIERQFGKRYKELFQHTALPGYVPFDDELARVAFMEAHENGIEFLKELREQSPQQDESPVAVSHSLDALHQKVQDRCGELFAHGHYSEAVEAGFKVVRGRLRELTSYETASDAFGSGKLYIEGAAADYVDSDFQNGCKFLMMAIDRFRNEKAHVVDRGISDPARAYEYLSVASLAMRHLDRARIRQT